MEERHKVYCKNCQRWYGNSIDQCEIPSCGIQYTRYGCKSDDEYEAKKAYCKAVGYDHKIDEKGIEFIVSHLKIIHFANSKQDMLYGHPSQLNRNNDCYFYLPKTAKNSKGIMGRLKSLFYNLLNN